MIQAPHKSTYVDRLRPVSHLLVQALQKAIPAATAFFSEKGRDINPTLFTVLVRYEVSLLLEAQRYVVVDDEALSLECQRLANIGLQIVHDHIIIKILKGSNGKAPVPATRTRVEFYSQQLAFIFVNDAADEANLTQEPNFLYTWEVDAAYKLKAVYLMCPREGGYKPEEVKTYWIENIPLDELKLAKKLHERPIQREDLPFAEPDRDVQESPSQ